MPPASLTVVAPSGHSKVMALDRLPFRIGRQSDNELVLRDGRASRRHARIIAEGGVYVLEDMQSTHGTFVNEQRIERHELANGDRITFGVSESYQITFTLAEGELSRLMGHFPAPPKATPGAEHLARLRAVVEVARTLQSSLSTETVLDAVVDAAITITGSERGFLLLRKDHDLDVRSARNDRGAHIAKDELQVPTKLINRALAERQDLLTMHFDPAGPGKPDLDASVAHLELRSAVCVPLVRVRTTDIQETVHTSLNETLGLLYLDSKSGAADMSGGNRELLQTLALEASTILENARLLDEERARQRLEEELQFARGIQQGLLPKRLPAAGWFRAAGSSRSSRQVGGDYFDAIPIRPDCWATIVADVSGKGVSSALLASVLQGVFLSGAETPEQIRAVLDHLNHYLIERTEGEKYATLFYSVLGADGWLHWTNAAHCSPILLKPDGRVSKLAPTGNPVGLLELATFDTSTTRLEPGDKLVIHSDGITDARSPAGEFYGDRRIAEFVRQYGAASCAELHDALLEDVDEFSAGAEQMDDITLLVIEYRPEAVA